MWRGVRRTLGLAAGAALLAAALLAPAAPAATGGISTVAGTGTGGFGGDGGAATSADLNGPDAVAPMPDGGYLIADYANNRVRRVAPDGTITTVAGIGTAGYTGDGFAATAAELNTPSALVATSDGGFLVTDLGNKVVRRVSAGGIITTVAGNGTDGFSGDGGPATAAQLFTPDALAETPDGGFLIADTNNHRIRKVSAGGTISTVAGTGAGFSGDGGPAAAAQLTLVFGVWTTPDGGYLIADSGNNRIRRVSAAGIITTIAGTGTAGYSGDGGPATAAQLDTPGGVAQAADGGVLITQSADNVVRRVSPDGTIATVAGNGTAGFSGDGGPATAAQLDGVTGVAPTPDGGFLISEFTNNRVRRVEGVQAPTVSGTNPPSGSTQSAIRVLGSAPPGSSVDLYTGAGCGGTPIATGSAADFASAGFPVTVADNSTTTFRARARQGAFTSACSSTSATHTRGSADPVIGKKVVISVVRGTVKKKCKGDGGFIKVTEATVIPVGCIVDTRNGRVRVTSAKNKAGAEQSAIFWQGIFRVRQKANNPLTTLDLTGFLNCPNGGGGNRVAGPFLAAARKKGNGLWGSGKGKFKSSGGGGSATVRGTIWYTQDRCSRETLFYAKQSSVLIKDFGDRTFVLKEGERYVTR